MSTAEPTSAPLSARAREILAAVERTVTDRRDRGPASVGIADMGDADSAQHIPDAPRRAASVEATDPLVALVLGVAEHTQRARATLDELSHALEKLARHLAFDR